MAAQEKNIKLLQELLVRIEARRRKQDGSIPAGVQVSLMEAAEPSSPEEAIPYMPEEFEVKPEPSHVPEPTEELDISPEVIESAAAPSGAFDEEEVGEVTDKVQVIPPIPAKFEEAAPTPQRIPPAKLVAEPPPAREAPIEIDAEAEFPEIEAEVAVETAGAAIKPEAPPAKAPGPTTLEGAPPFKEARPFQTTGQPVIIPKATIGQLLQKAFDVGEHREE